MINSWINIIINKYQINYTNSSNQNRSYYIDIWSNWEYKIENRDQTEIYNLQEFIDKVKKEQEQWGDTQASEVLNDDFYTKVDDINNAFWENADVWFFVDNSDERALYMYKPSEINWKVKLWTLIKTDGATTKFNKNSKGIYEIPVNRLWIESKKYFILSEKNALIETDSLWRTEKQYINYLEDETWINIIAPGQSDSMYYISLNNWKNIVFFIINDNWEYWIILRWKSDKVDVAKFIKYIRNNSALWVKPETNPDPNSLKYANIFSLDELYNYINNWYEWIDMIDDRRQKSSIKWTVESLEDRLETEQLSIEEKVKYNKVLTYYYIKTWELESAKSSADRYIRLIDNNWLIISEDLFDYEYIKTFSRYNPTPSDKESSLNNISSFYWANDPVDWLTNEQLLQINEHLVDYDWLRDTSDFMPSDTKDLILWLNINWLEYNRWEDWVFRFIYGADNWSKWQISEMPWYEDQFWLNIKDKYRSLIIKEVWNPLKQVVVPYEDLRSGNLATDYIEWKIQQAKNDYESEERDEANIRDFEINSPEKLMYISFSDSSDDPVTSWLRKDWELMWNIISERRDWKTTIQENDTFPSWDKPIKKLESYFENADNRWINDIVLNLIWHWDREWIYFWSWVDKQILRVYEIRQLLLSYPNINVTINTVACHWAGIESLTELKSLRRNWKLTSFLQVQEHVTNQEWRIDWIDNSSWDPKVYSSYYNIYFIHYLNKYPNRNYWEIHLLADKMAKLKVWNNAQVIVNDWSWAVSRTRSLWFQNS